MNVVMVGSQKNNIGKTVMALKLGIEIAGRGKNVLLMDLSSGKVKMSEYLKVEEDIIYDIADVIMDTCTLEHGIIEIIENLSLLPFPRVPEKINQINKESFTNLIDSAIKYDYIIIDVDKLTSSYIDFSKINNVISLNNNDFSCIKEINSDKIISLKSSNFIPVLNKYNKTGAKKGIMIKLKDIEKLTENTILAAIEENINYLELGYEKLFSPQFLTSEINIIINSLK